MKKVIHYFLGSFILILSACQEQPKKESNPETTQKSKGEIAAPQEIISLDKADSLYVNYSKRRVESIEKTETLDRSEPFKAVRFISFNLETIKEYITYIEQEAQRGGTQVDSLRIYLGNYGQVKGANDRHNTVFLLPAAKADGGYGGIYIGDDGKAKLISNHFNKNETSKASIMPTLNTSLMQGKGSLILNFGHCCPPQNSDF